MYIVVQTYIEKKGQPENIFIPKSELSTKGPKMIDDWIINEEGESSRYMPSMVINTGITQDLAMHSISKSKGLYMQQQ